MSFGSSKGSFPGKNAIRNTTIIPAMARMVPRRSPIPSVLISAVKFPPFGFLHPQGQGLDDVDQFDFFETPSSRPRAEGVILLFDGQIVIQPVHEKINSHESGTSRTHFVQLDDQYFLGFGKQDDGVFALIKWISAFFGDVDRFFRVEDSSCIAVTQINVESLSIDEFHLSFRVNNN